MKNFIRLFFLLIVQFIIAQEKNIYKPTQLPDDVNDLFISTGNTNSKNVLLIIQGGPFSQFEISENYNKWKNKMEIVYVKQAQIINSTILLSENKMSINDAYKENIVSVNIIHKVIYHFKNKHKKVLVYGFSYGGFLIEKYIAMYGIEADAVSISASRLNLEEIIWKSTLKQISYDVTYKKDGSFMLKKMSTAITKPVSLLLTSITKERFIKLLSDKDLSKLVLYQYGKKDGTVCRLNNNEIKFLASKKVSIIAHKRNYHRQMLSKKISNIAIKKMLKFIKEH